MPKLLLFSDLHLRGDEPWPFPDEMPDFDIAVAAGDIDDAPVLSMARMMKEPSLDGKYILFVPGNHEFYGLIIEDFEASDPEMERLTCVTNLHMKVDVVEGVRFVGATLWTDYRLQGDDDLKRTMHLCQREMKDHAKIRTRDGMPVDDDPDILPRFRRPDRFFTPDDALRRHREQVRFLDEALSVPFDGQTVVVTHHAPHPESISLAFRRNRTNPAYASDLTWLIEKHEPALWVHGHIHSPSDYRIGRTRIVANPKGTGTMKGGTNDRFDPWKVVEVG